MNRQSGQTLIETLVAAFILVMGISAALGLATYSLSATNAIRQETVALGLAREGIEVVKNIRDTNWMKDTISSSCYDFLSASNSAFCYPNWMNPSNPEGQDISAASGPRTFTLRFDTAQDNPWVLVPTTDEFGLVTPNLNSPFNVYYSGAAGISATEGNSGFARAITITQDSGFTPFNQNTGPRLKVTSHVWWSGKNCPMTDSIPTDRKCSVVLETYLTNWRNF